jgi:hypothetical protein
MDKLTAKCRKVGHIIGGKRNPSLEIALAGFKEGEAIRGYTFNSSEVKIIKLKQSLGARSNDDGDRRTLICFKIA